MFDGSTEMAKYGAVKQHPYSFQDDVLIQVESVEDLRATNVKMTEVMNMMQTELNKTKSGYILMGTEEQLAKARQRMKEEPMMCNGFVMMELKEEKWLGDYFAGGLKESVRLTIKKREAKIRRASFEIVNSSEGLQSPEGWRIQDRFGAVGELCHPLPLIQLLDLGGNRERGGEAIEWNPGLLLENALGDGTRSTQSGSEGGHSYKRDGESDMEGKDHAGVPHQPHREEGPGKGDDGEVGEQQMARAGGRGKRAL